MLDPSLLESLGFARDLKVTGGHPSFLHLPVAGVSGPHPPPAKLVDPNDLHLLVEGEGDTVVLRVPRAVQRDGSVVARGTGSLDKKNTQTDGQTRR